MWDYRFDYETTILMLEMTPCILRPEYKRRKKKKSKHEQRMITSKKICVAARCLSLLRDFSLFKQDPQLIPVYTPLRI